MVRRLAVFLLACLTACVGKSDAPVPAPGATVGGESAGEEGFEDERRDVGEFDDAEFDDGEFDDAEFDDAEFDDAELDVGELTVGEYDGPPRTLLEVPGSGTCLGLADAVASNRMPMLSDRIRMSFPPGSQEVPLGAANVAAPSRQRTTMRRFGHDEASMAVVVDEHMLTAVDARGVMAWLESHADVDEPADVSVVSTTRGASIVVERPRRVYDVMGDVDVLRAWVLSRDGYVLSIRFVTTPEAARSGGCDVFAARLAAGFESGDRTLRDDAGRHAITPSLDMDVPSGFHVSVDEGPDFEVVRVAAPSSVDHAGAALGLYFGGHPSFFGPEEATSEEIELLGARHELRTWAADGTLHGELVAGDDGSYLHLFFQAADANEFARVRQMISTLSRRAAPPRSTLACAPRDGGGRLLRGAARIDDTDVARLRAATRFVLGPASLGEGALPEHSAFLRVAALERARDAFLDLAAHGTTAGKLYGLAGLRVVDRATFDTIVCATRASLEPDVEVRDVCGASRRASAAIVHDPAAFAGEPFWTDGYWRSSMATRPADLAGGGLAMSLRDPRPTDAQINAYALAFGERGADALAPTPYVVPPPPSGARSELPSFFVRGGEILYVDDRGRVQLLPSENPRRRDIPDLVRFPRDYLPGLVSCAIDQDRHLVCSHDPASARVSIAQRCGLTLPSGSVVSRYDDGPYVELVEMGLGGVCARREDGTIRCVADPSEATASRGEPDEPDAEPRLLDRPIRRLFDAGFSTVIVDMNGHVRITSPEFENEQDLGLVEGLRAVRGEDQYGLFFELEDGRVLVLGDFDFARDREIDAPRADFDAWVLREVPELRGSSVGAAGDTYCALRPDRRVFCWGRNEGIEPSLPIYEDLTAREVPALRGAEVLLMSAEFGVCVAMNRSTVRCLRSPQYHEHGPFTPRPPRDVTIDRAAP